MSASPRGRPKRRDAVPPPDPVADPHGTDRMDIKLIRRLVRLMTGGKISELEIDDTQSGLRVRLKRGGVEAQAQPSPLVYHVPGAPSGLPAPQAGAPQGGPTRTGVGADAGLVPVTSPLVGTFYRAASPDSDPYAEVGKRIVADTIVCIVEAMKVMNEIKAEVAGEIVQILVENGEPVEYGQPLFLVKKG